MEIWVWPIAVIVIALGFCWMFRVSIGAAISRIHHVGKSGVTIYPNAESAKQQQETKSSSADEIISEMNSLVLQEQEKAIRADLDNRGLSEHGEREKVLVRVLAANQIAYCFERISSRIFASQVALLRTANSRETEGLSVAEVEAFYKLSLGGQPDNEAEYGVSGYTRFLLDNHLIAVESGRYKITFLGRDFLGYLIHNEHTGPQYM